MHLLGLFAHPDDEAFAAGALIALAVRDGARVTIACATRGESGSSRSTLDGMLGDVRSRELAASCSALGADPPVFLDLRDGGLDRASAASAVGKLLRRLKPDVVVTLGDDGAYGHRDHIALTGGLADAVASLDTPPRVLHAQFPRGMFEPVWRALRRVAPSPVVDTIQLGADIRHADLRVDVAPVRDAKLAAIAAHASQLIDGDPRSFLRRGLIDRLLDAEHYRVASGPALPDGAGSMFAGL